MLQTDKRGAAFCRHFGACGGCAIQNLTPEEQLAFKQDRLKTFFSGFWTSPIPIHPSPVRTYYRNKAEFSFSRQPEGRTGTGGLIFENRLGFKARERWDKAVDIEECFLVSPEISSLLAGVRKWTLDSGLPFYDLRRHDGFYRHLVVREGKNTNERMVMLVTAEGNLDAGGFAETVNDVYPASTVLWAINKRISDVAVGDEIRILSGPGFIEEKLIIPPGKIPLHPPLLKGETGGFENKELLFKISPNSFFQTNTLGAQALYSRVRALAAEAKPEVLWDLYGGSGAFSMACSDIAGKSVCVESSAQSIEDGKRNASVNGIGNIEFVCAKTEDFFSAHGGDVPGLVIADPPRCGFHPKALEKLLEIKPPEIIYVSCNPAALARDLKALVQSYKIENIEGIDLFPQTEHVETVVSLRLI